MPPTPILLSQYVNPTGNYCMKRWSCRVARLEFAIRLIPGTSNLDAGDAEPVFGGRALGWRIPNETGLQAWGRGNAGIAWSPRSPLWPGFHDPEFL